MKRSHRRKSLVAAALAIGLGVWLHEGEATEVRSGSAEVPKQADRSYRASTANLDAPEAWTEAKENPRTDSPIAGASVRCPVEADRPIPEDTKIHIRLLSDGLEPYGWAHTGNELMLTGVSPAGTAVFRMRGHPRVEFSWTEEGCGPIVLGQTAIIRGVVNNAYLEDTDRTHLHGCGARGLVADDGTFEINVLAEPCELVIQRRDGLLLAASEPEFFEPKVGEIIEVEIDLPPYRLAGLGFGFEMVSGGVEVLLVHADTPASDQGLEVGDTILSVDGEPTDAMNKVDFRRTVGGKPGSQVELSVLRGDEEVTLHFAREDLDHTMPEPEERGKRSKWGKHP